MSISTYFRPNIHQNGPEILGVKTGNILVMVRELFDSFHDCSTYTVLRVVVVLKIYKMGCL